MLARKPATSMPPIRPENHKQKESPPSESQGARGNGNWKISSKLPRPQTRGKFVAESPQKRHHIVQNAGKSNRF